VGASGARKTSAERNKIRMVEICFHGRGGQGAVVAGQMLAVAAFREGKHSQALSIPGPERRGAPVVSFVRIDDAPVRLKCRIYKPDHVIVLDAPLLRYINITGNLNDGGWIVVNSNKKPEEMGFPAKFKVATVDANSIALKHRLGTAQAPIVNTAILGAFAKVTGIVGLEAVSEAVRQEAPAKKEENVAATRDAYELVRGAQGKE